MECDREHRGVKPKERKEPTTGAAPQEKPAAAGKKAPKERRGSLDTGRIYRLAKVNPRKQGTHGWKSWNLIRDGMTVMEYLAAGGRRNDLAWDIEHKHVEVRD